MNDPPSDDVSAWLRRAREALANTEARPGGGFSDPCYMAQQAAERALKGLLIARGMPDFPYTHDIVRLLKLVQERTSLALPDEVRAAGLLGKYATAERYPPFGVETREEYERAIASARAVVEWVEEQLRGDG